MNQVLVASDEAMLFVTDRAGDGAVHERMLDEAPMRMAVTAARRRVVALADQAETGARWQVCVTPCLVLDNVRGRFTCRVTWPDSTPRDSSRVLNR